MGPRGLCRPPDLGGSRIAAWPSGRPRGDGGGPSAGLSRGAAAGVVPEGGGKDARGAGDLGAEVGAAGKNEKEIWTETIGLKLRYFSGDQLQLGVVVLSGRSTSVLGGLW